MTTSYSTTFKVNARLKFAFCQKLKKIVRFELMSCLLCLDIWQLLKRARQVKIIEFSYFYQARNSRLVPFYVNAVFYREQRWCTGKSTLLPTNVARVHFSVCVMCGLSLLILFCPLLQEVFLRVLRSSSMI